jgi:hypothetical protein
MWDHNFNFRDFTEILLAYNSAGWAVAETSHHLTQPATSAGQAPAVVPYMRKCRVMSGSRVLQMIVSGGQTGVDRAALDVALELGIPCGGWCPKGRLAVDGVA